MTEQFVTLINHPNYEMLNVEPFTIRKKKNKKILTETLDSTGYIILMLQDDDKRRKCSKHRLIAEQFIPNPDNLPQVDHINTIRTDNTIKNLRWVTQAENNRNKATYCNKVNTYVDEINPDSIVFDHYGVHEFIDYYFDETVNKFYFWNGSRFRELPVNKSYEGYEFVNMVTIKHKKVSVFYSKFKRLYGLI